MSKSDKPAKPAIDSTIAAALITVIGGIVTTLIITFANRPAPPTPTPIILPTSIAITDTPTVAPTDTVAPGEPTSTPLPPTNTPEPTLTLTATLEPVALGEDWSADCLSALWKAYPDTIGTSDKGDGCLNEPVYVFSVDNGGLDFVAQRSGSGVPEVYGLFAPLPEKGEVTLNVSLKDLTNVDLWMGVFSEADINSHGILITIPSGDVKKRVIIQKDLTTYKTLLSTQPLAQGSGYNISFRFSAGSVTGIVNPNVFITNPVSLPSARKWLFLGYKGLSGSYQIDGRFFNLTIK